MKSGYGPDLAANAKHTTTGSVIVGARGPLVAYNISLTAGDAKIAMDIATKIRAHRATVPELEGVRAIGMYLDTANCAQVSMNLTQPLQSPLPSVFNYVQELAGRLGAELAYSEIVGVIPRASLAGKSPESVMLKHFEPSQIIENWIQPQGERL